MCEYNIMNEGWELLSKIGLLFISISVFTTFMFILAKQLSLEPATNAVLLSTYIFIILIFIGI